MRRGMRRFRGRRHRMGGRRRGFRPRGRTRGRRRGMAGRRGIRIGMRM